MRVVQMFLLVLALAVLCIGASQITSNVAYAGNCGNGSTCGCGTAYAPVVCSGNCIYVNMCHATCAGAKNCKSRSN